MLKRSALRNSQCLLSLQKHEVSAPDAAPVFSILETREAQMIEVGHLIVAVIVIVISFYGLLSRESKSQQQDAAEAMIARRL